MKKLLALILCLALVLSLAACAGKTDESESTKATNDTADTADTKDTAATDDTATPSKRAPAYNGGHGEGADFRMDGATYFASNAGDFQAGEQVHFSYLPNSHVLTNIVPADHGPSQAAPAATTWQDWFIVVLLVAVMLGIVLSIRKEKAKAAPM